MWLWGGKMRFNSPTGAFYKYNNKKSHKWISIIEIIFIILVLSTLALLIFEFIYEKIDIGSYKVKGTLISVNSHKLLNDISGQGKHTVLLESDLKAPIEEWTQVKTQVSYNARVVCYERAGHSWSDSSADKISIENSVSDLKSVLKKSGGKAPFILVGHGYGGLIISEYAKEYPDEVMGMILIDSYTDNYVTSKEFKKQLDNKLTKAYLNKYISYVGGVRLEDKLGLIKEDNGILNFLGEDTKGLYLKQRITPKFNKTYYDELNALKSYKANSQTKGLLGDKPLTVITTTNASMTAAEKESWMNYQKNLLKLSTNSNQIVLENSSTYVEAENSDIIINNINDILKKYGK